MRCTHHNWAPSSYFFDKVREVYLQMFRNELGMPSVPMYNSLRKFIPTAESTANVNSPIFPLDSIWAEHGAWDVSNYCYRSYDNAIRTMFGDPKTAKEYADNAQFLSADGYRAMFEAANHRMWDITSGVMIWKINSCWRELRVTPGDIGTYMGARNVLLLLQGRGAQLVTLA